MRELIFTLKKKERKKAQVGNEWSNSLPKVIASEENATTTSDTLFWQPLWTQLSAGIGVGWGVETVGGKDREREREREREGVTEKLRRREMERGAGG